MSQPTLAWAAPPPPSSQVLTTKDKELSSFRGGAVENGDASYDVILGHLATLRGIFT